MYGMRILPEACAAFFGTNPTVIKTGEIQKENFGARYSMELQSQLNSCENFRKLSLYTKIT